MHSILDPRLPQPPDYPGVPRDVARAVKELVRSRIVCSEDETAFIDAAIIEMLLPYAAASLCDDPVAGALPDSHLGLGQNPSDR
jgi:hypothetical protein